MRVALLAVAAIGSTVFVAAPGIMMMPTRAHTVQDLERTFFLVTWAPVVTSVLGVLGLVLAFGSFRSGKPLSSRMAALVCLSALGGSVFFSFVRPAENVFAPITQVRFIPAASAGFLEPEDMVLGVRLDGVAKAYPVGQLVYHHLVNDVVAGIPIVATF